MVIVKKLVVLLFVACSAHALQNITNSCCEVHSTPGCSNPAVQDCVCSVDPYCCQVAWESSCVYNAEAFGCYQASQVWEGMSNMPFAADGVAATAVGSDIFVAGGYGDYDEGVIRVLRIYMSMYDSWYVTTMPFAVSGASMVQGSQRTVVMGGTTSELEASTLTQVLAADTWLFGAPAPHDFTLACACTLGDIAYVFGGEDKNGRTWDDVLVYDIQANTWKNGGELLELKVPRSRAACVADEEKDIIYVIGGYHSETDTILDSVEIYSFGGNFTHTYGTPIPEPTYMLGAALLNGTELWIAGGANGVTTFDTSYSFQESTHSWVSGPILNEARYGFGFATYNDGQSFFVAGGAYADEDDSGHYLNSTESFTLADAEEICA